MPKHNNTLEVNELDELYDAIKMHLVQSQVLTAKERARFIHDYRYALNMVCCTVCVYDKVQGELTDVVAHHVSKERYETAANLMWLKTTLENGYEKLRRA